MFRFLFALIIFLAGVAFAQDAAVLPSLDPSKLGADVFALGGMVLFVVQFVKRQVERPSPARPGGRKPPAWVWWGLSLVLAEAGAAGLFYAKFGATFGELPAPWGWLAFGVLAGLVAAGFKDFVMGVVKAQPASPRIKPDLPPPVTQ